MTGSFLEAQARIGVTVHIGGRPITRALLSACHADEAAEILEVGCGIGAGTVLAARAYGCRVVGVDVSPRMVEWARRRAAEAGVGGRVELRVADVRALPFADGRFDAVVAESVLSFVPDKERALAEMVRVTRPGGWVGVDEMFLRSARPSPSAVVLERLLTTDAVTLDAWQSLWAASGLTDRVVRSFRIDIAREIRSRLRWVGAGWLLRASVRLVWLYLSERSCRPALRLMLGRPPAAPGNEATPSPWSAFGYALFVGRKPLPGEA